MLYKDNVRYQYASKTKKSKYKNLTIDQKNFKITARKVRKQKENEDYEVNTERNRMQVYNSLDTRHKERPICQLHTFVKTKSRCFAG